MRKKANTFLAAASVIAVVACGPKEAQTADSTGQDSSAMLAGDAAQAETDVPYTLAQNYFVKNNVKPEQLTSPKITSQEQFDSFFGAAPTMGKDGQPTPIDFSKQYVMAYIGKETDFPTTLAPKWLKKKDGKITLSFQIMEGEAKQSFTTVPVLVVIVDKQYEGEPQIEFFQVK